MFAECANLVGRSLFWGATPRPPSLGDLPQAPRLWFVRSGLEAVFVKKILALAAVAGAVLFIVRRSRSAKAEADLWREATAPTDK